MGGGSQEDQAGQGFWKVSLLRGVHEAYPHQGLGCLQSNKVLGVDGTAQDWHSMLPGSVYTYTCMYIHIHVCICVHVCVYCVNTPLYHRVV